MLKAAMQKQLLNKLSSLRQSDKLAALSSSVASVQQQTELSPSVSQHQCFTSCSSYASAQAEHETTKQSGQITQSNHAFYMSNLKQKSCFSTSILQQLQQKTSQFGPGGYQLHQQRSVTYRSKSAKETPSAAGLSSEINVSTLREKGKILLPASFLILLGGCGLVIWMRQYNDYKLQERLSKQDKTTGTAAVGGPFLLYDQDGNPFSSDDLKGQFTLLYFGFTHCPDICPDEMEKMAEAVDLVEQKTGQVITPLFITVDPARDHAPQVKKYVAEFHPRMVGLVGGVEEVKKVCKVFRVYFSKTDEDGPNDYLIDHSIIMYLLNPKAEFQSFYGRNFDKDQLAESICEHIEEWKAENPEYPTVPMFLRRKSFAKQRFKIQKVQNAKEGST